MAICIARLCACRFRKVTMFDVVHILIRHSRKFNSFVQPYPHPVYLTFAGVGQPTSGEPLTALSKEEAQTGALQFADNLKNNMPKLWLEFLSTCSESTCPCCQSAPRDSSEPDMHTKLAQNGVGHSKAQMLANSLEIDQTHGVQINTKIDGTTFGKPTNRSYDCQGCESNKKMILLKGKGCEHLDPFVQICHLAILCCGKCTIAELLAEATVMMLSDGGVLERTSFKKLLVVMRVMQMVAGQGRGAQVLEMWAQILVKLLAKANTEQVLLTVPMSISCRTLQLRVVSLSSACPWSSDAGAALLRVRIDPQSEVFVLILLIITKDHVCFLLLHEALVAQNTITSDVSVFLCEKGSNLYTLCK